MLKWIVGALILVGQAAAAQPADKPQDKGEQKPPATWLRTGTRILSVPARTAFPLSAGPLSFAGTREMSHPGEGIDDTVQYRSADGAIIGTIYVYLPGLSHPGLAAYATEAGMRLNSETALRIVRTAVVEAGGQPAAAVRTEYDNYMGENATIAAFAKAGRWMLKFRVSGPQSRSVEVGAAMSALLAGIEFGNANPPHQATALTVTDCAAGAGAEDARLLPDPPAAELPAHALLATFDGGGIEAQEKGKRNDLPSRVPPDLCLSSRIGEGRAQFPILRGPDGPPRSVDGRTRLVAMLTDSGRWLEVVHATNVKRYVLLYHEIGRTSLLGGYDGVPSDRQIAELVNNPGGEAGRIRVPVRFRPNQGAEIYLPSLPKQN